MLSQKGKGESAGRPSRRAGKSRIIKIVLLLLPSGSRNACYIFSDLNVIRWLIFIDIYTWIYIRNKKGQHEQP
jgi:hypothetical protein